MHLKKKITALAAITVLSGIISIASKVNSLESDYYSKYLTNNNFANTISIESKINTEENKPTIIINPGHDDTYTGFPVKGYREEVLNLELSKKIEKLLTEDDYKVLLVRTSGATINTDNLDINKDKSVNWEDELFARANYIKDNKSDCAIIIHYNACKESSKINGMEIYFYGLGSSKQLSDKTLNFNYPEGCRIYSESSKDIAEKLAEFANTHGVKAKVYGSDPRELVENPTKTVLYIEAGYLTNPSDLKSATTDEGQMKTAALISDFFRENKEYIMSLKQDSSNLKIMK